MHALRHLPMSRGGQAVAEFLLILPFFLMFILLLVDFGLLMYEYVSVANAVREGARFGAVNCGTGRCEPAKIVQRVVERSGGILTTQDQILVVWVDNNSNGRNYDRGDSVVVTARHRYNFIFLPAVGIDVYSCADMRLEQADDSRDLPSGNSCAGGS